MTITADTAFREQAHHLALIQQFTDGFQRTAAAGVGNRDTAIQAE